MRQDVQVLQTMIDTMVGKPKFSYPARQNYATKPAGEFAHVRLLEEYQVGIPFAQVTGQTSGETTMSTISPVRLRFRVGVVDTDGVSAAKIMHGWTSEAMKALMLSSGYGFIRCTPLSNEDAKLEKEWEYRQGFSIEMYATRYYEEVLSNITSLVVSGKFVDTDLEEYLMQFDINN